MRLRPNRAERPREAGRDPRSLRPGPYLEIDGRSVAYERWGDEGAPIVLVSGFVEPSFVWEPVARRLASTHRLVATDLVGFGYSERRGPYTLETWANQVEGVLDALELGRSVLVGHSLGAAAVAEVARRAPGRVAGLVLLAGDALEGSGLVELVRTVLVEPLATATLRLVLGSDRLFAAILRLAYGPAHPPIGEGLVEAWRRPFDVRGSRDALRAMRQRPIPGLDLATLGAIETRALVVWGSKDRITPAKEGRASAEALGARFEVVDGAGHLLMLTHPQEVAELLAGFTSPVDPRPR